MKTQNSNASLFGAAAALVAFLVTGLVPALVYGGYMGLMLAGALFGHGTSDILASRIVTGAGMVVGTLATLSLYLVVGALVGHAVGAAVRRAAPATPETEDTEHRAH